ncbi:hypothetical protein ACFLSJ_04995 [Verrucomicrobiota bacterium]
MRKKRFVFNNDGTFILSNGVHGHRPLTPSDVEDYVDLVAGTHVTSFFICTNSSMPYYESRYDRSIGCLRPDTLPGDGRHPHEGDNCELYGRNIMALREQGTDIVELCVNRARARGMEAFATMRMNDLHFTDPAIRYPPGQGDFWLEHPEYYLADASLGWHADGALNFAHAEVREHKLNIAREICERFDIDGIELDFMRFPVYFPGGMGEANVPVMTDFVRAARSVTRDVGGRRGRPLELTLRVPPRLDLCRNLGFDPREYVRERLIDFLTIGPFFHDFPTVPVAAFREALGDDAIPIYAAMDHAVVRHGSHGDFRGRAANRHRQGADGIYLFNFFFGWDGTEPTGLFCAGPSRDLLNELDGPDLLTSRNKIYSAGYEHGEYGMGLDFVLPAELASGQSLCVPIETSETAEGMPPQRVLLFVRAQGLEECAVEWNGASVAPIADKCLSKQYGQAENVQSGATVDAYDLPPASLRVGTNDVTVRAAGTGGHVLQVALAVDYGEPQSHGYF